MIPVIIKNSQVAGRVPALTDLALGEMGINTYDGKLYIKKDDGTPAIIEIGSGVAGAGLTWAIYNADVTTTANAGILMDTTLGAKTVTLHSNPAIGDTVCIVDYAGTFGFNNVTVAAALLYGSVQTLTLDLTNQVVTLMYLDNVKGWKITQTEPNDVLVPQSSGRKNYIINGDFKIWQRAASQTTADYGSDDRWKNWNFGSTKEHSRMAFVAGQTEVPGNPTYYSRTVVTSVAGVNNNVNKSQPIEDVISLSGKTATVSFYAKADSPKNIVIEFVQNFGANGSAGISGIGLQLVALTASWQKFVINIVIPSVTGKTIGVGSSLQLKIWFEAGTSSAAAILGQQSGTFDLSQIQVEEGPIATEFERRTYADELFLCQRYYENCIIDAVRTTLSIYNISYAEMSAIFFNVPKRSIPVIVLGTMTPTGHVGTMGTLYSPMAKLTNISPIYNWTSGVAGHACVATLNSWTADAEL